MRCLHVTTSLSMYGHYGRVRLGTGSGTVKSVTGRTLAIGTISFEKPNEFRELMMQNKIAAYLSDRRQGCSNLMDVLPLLTFKNENVEGEYLHFNCIEDIVQRR